MSTWVHEYKYLPPQTTVRPPVRPDLPRTAAQGQEPGSASSPPTILMPDTTRVLTTGDNPHLVTSGPDVVVVVDVVDVVVVVVVVVVV